MAHPKQQPRRQPDRRLLGGNELDGGSRSDPPIRRLATRIKHARGV